ncbi:MAG: type I DNA topoisomerase [Armatimonadota bacterium]
MAKAAIIVESPTKTKTLAGFLGKDYILLASMGHVRDLPEGDLAVDVENNFAPKYDIIPRQKKTITKLKSELKGIKEVYLASDPDREGEAIAWHLAQVLGLENPKRIEFNEITEEAVKTALAHPREIDIDRVDAQQARRILDRLVGYEISPLLWRRIGSRGGTALSAGRVQSAALRLVCEREREIAQFVPVEYWSLDVELTPQGKPQPFKAAVKQVDGKDLDLTAEDQAKPLADELANATYTVASVEKKPRTRSAQPPFITSSLQRQAANELHFSARKTMMVAEQLYQGVETDEGTVGLITYMRTDSTRIADQAVQQTREFIKGKFGEEYVGPGVRGKTAKGAQEAHEAIRPTSTLRLPEQMQPFLDKDQYNLYDLIWRRLVASQMSPAKFEQVTVQISAGRFGLRATGSSLQFPGFLAVMPDKEEEEKVGILAELLPEQPLDLVQVLPEQHFTKPPPRYTEATLVQELEENGIGRPSTYAAIIETLRQRKYVRMKERSFVATPTGCAVYDYLLDHFPHIIDIEFTAHVEEDLDEVEDGDKDWVSVLRGYYDDLQTQMTAAKDEKPQILEGEVCPKCGGALVIKYSMHGKFAGCEKYPECDFTKNLGIEIAEKVEVEPVGRDCPECKAALVYRTGFRGKRFIACSGYPKCKYTEQIGADGIARPKLPPKESGIACDKCGAMMYIRESKRGPFLGCSKFPRCRNIMSISLVEGYEAPPAQEAEKPKELEESCPECGKPLLIRRSRRGEFVGCSGYPKCKYTRDV